MDTLIRKARAVRVLGRLNDNPSRGACGATWPDADLHILAKRQQKAHQTLYGKTIQPVVLQCRYLRLTDFEARSRCNLRKPLSGNQSIDLYGQTDLRVELCGIRQSQIRKDISRARLDAYALSCSSCHNAPHSRLAQPSAADSPVSRPPSRS